MWVHPALHHSHNHGKAVTHTGCCRRDGNEKDAATTIALQIVTSKRYRKGPTDTSSTRIITQYQIKANDECVCLVVVEPIAANKIRTTRTLCGNNNVPTKQARSNKREPFTVHRSPYKRMDAW